jgi:hypothetical protein
VGPEPFLEEENDSGGQWDRSRSKGDRRVSPPHDGHSPLRIGYATNVGYATNGGLVGGKRRWCIDVAGPRHIAVVADPSQYQDGVITDITET